MASRGMDRQKLAVVGVILAIICFVALNTFGSLTLRRMRLDLTQNRQFTLSHGTEQLLAGIDEPVTLRLYVSSAVRQANPFLGTYADRVQDMLETYAAASNGRITVELIDPEPFSPDEDRAVGFGLQPIPLDNRGTNGYFGLAGTNSTDDVDVLPVLSPERERFLEYDLTRMVYNLANPEKPVVAVLSSLPLNGDPTIQYQPWQLLSSWGSSSTSATSAASSPSSTTTRKLLLVQPQNLSDKTLYAIDQFVLGGGKVAGLRRSALRGAGDAPAPAAGHAAGRHQCQPAEAAQGLGRRAGGRQARGRPDGGPAGAVSERRPRAGDRLPGLAVARAASLSGSEVMTSELNR